MDRRKQIKNLAGFASIILFILISNPFIKFALAVTYIIYSIISGLRVKLLPNFILFFTLTLVNVMVPSGEILLEIGFLTLTKEALYKGIDRASLLIGLLYISRNISLTNIKLPGRAGRIIKDTFSYFTQLTNGERIVPNRDLLKQIDDRLLNLKDEDSVNDVTQGKKSGNPALLLILTLGFFTLDIILLYF